MDIHLVRQEQRFECGIACLATIGAYYGKGENLKDYRRLFFLSSQKRQSFLDLSNAARKLSLTAIGIEIDSLDNSIPLPCIAQLTPGQGMLHFVVIFQVGEKFIVGDPARGLILFLPDKFYSVFTGKILILIPAHTT